METVPFYFDRSVEEHASKTYLKYLTPSGDVGEITFGETGEKVNRLARGLQKMGVKKGTMVGLFMVNHPNYVYLIYALAKLGGVAVTVNTGQKGEALAHIFNSSNTKFLFIDEPFLPQVEALGSEVKFEKTVVHGTSAFDELFDDDSSRFEAPADQHKDDPLAIMFTSGTTSLPKGVILPHFGFISTGKIHLDVVQHEPNDVYYTCLPLFHCNATQLTMMGCLVGGHTLAMGGRFNPVTFWDELEKFGATSFTYLGSLLNNLYAHRQEKHRKNNIRIAGGGGASSIPDVWREFEAFYDVKLIEGYGLTETNAICYFNRKGNVEVGTVGEPVDGYEVKIVDPYTRETLPLGERGILCVREKEHRTRMSLGYLDKAKTEEAWDKDGWFYTGDICTLDENNRARFFGRTADMFRAGGENVSTATVEAALSHDEGEAKGIKEACYVGVTSKYGGEDQVGFLYLVLRDDFVVENDRGETLQSYEVAVQDKGDVVISPVSENGKGANIIQGPKLIEEIAPQVLKQAVPTYVQVVKSIPLTLTGKPKKSAMQAAADVKQAWQCR